MIVYINKPRYHWLSPYTIIEKAMFWREIDYDEPVVQRWHNRLMPFCTGLQKVADALQPKIDYVKLHKYDTWSMDNTLACIIYPMLLQLKATKHGAPMVEDIDVPPELHKVLPASPYDVDDNHFKRWDWVLDEMIFAFEHINKDIDTLDEELEARMQNGFRLFGKYYRALWD